MKFSMFSGIYQDVRKRIPYYASDWTDGLNYRVIPATVFIYFTNILPAIAFAQDMFDRTRGAYGVNEVLLASAMGGVVFGVFAGQPLCIVGVTGPISIFNYTVFELIEPKGIPYFPFMAWICIWSFAMHTIIAVFEGVMLMKVVTLFSCDMFGCFINIIYLEKGIQLLIRQFENIEVPTASSIGGAYFSIVVALCLLIFGLGFIVIAEYSRFFNPVVREFISDYSLPLLVVFFTGFSHFPGRISDLEVQRLPVDIAYQPSTDFYGRDYGWFIHFWDIKVGHVFLAIPFALLLTALFYFDHNISSIMAQGPQFRLRKPASFHFDFFLLGVTTLVSGLLGLPAPNGLIPQAPLHTTSLRIRNDPNEKVELNENEEGINADACYVVEQRVTNTMQGLLTLGTMSGPLLKVLHTIPQGVLAGLFWMMATSLFKNEVLRRAALLVTEPGLRDPTEPLNRVPRKYFLSFFALSVIGVAAEVAITNTKGAIGFPGVLLLFMYIATQLPRFIPKEYLDILDGPAASIFTMRTLDPHERKNHEKSVLSY